MASSTPPISTTFSTNSLDQIEKDKEYWLEDGNIIIVATGGPAIGFRVYKGLIARASPVFRDLFSVPPPVDMETVEGCPVVRLPDAPSDLRNFLYIVIDGAGIE